jgi:hypothetical protein
VIDSNLMFVVVWESGGSVIQIPNNLFFQRMFKVTGERNRYLFEEYEPSASKTDLTDATMGPSDTA